MILWSSKEDPETRGDSCPCSAFRWTFQIGLWSIGFVHQHQQKSNRVWYDSHTNVVELYLTKHFRFGFEHIWYDGPHCIFSIGFLHFIYSGLNQDCKECYGK